MPRKTAKRLEKPSMVKNPPKGRGRKQTNSAFVAGINTDLPKLTPEQERERRKFHEATAAQIRQYLVLCGYLEA